MRFRRSVTIGGAVLALLATSVLGGAQSAHAVNVPSPGPLTDIDLNPDLSCQALRAGDTDDAFYGVNACGTFVHVDGDNLRSDRLGRWRHRRRQLHPGLANAVVGQRLGALAVHGRHCRQLGRRRVHDQPARPVHRRSGALDDDRDGHQHRRRRGRSTSTAAATATRPTPTTVSAASPARRRRASRRAAACRRSSRTRPATPTTRPATARCGRRSAHGGPLPDTCRCDELIDNGVAVGWSQMVGAGAAVTVSASWFLSSPFVSFAPQRILDTRPDGETVDDLFEKGGIIAGGTVLELQVGGRAGVAGDANSAILNVATVGSTGAGFLTLWPCGTPRPTRRASTTSPTACAASPSTASSTQPASCASSPSPLRT